MSRPRLNVLGAGRLGRTLARLWADAGLVEVQALLGRDATRLAQAQAFVGQGEVHTRLDTLPDAELWLLSVPDAQIAPITQALAQLGRHPALVWHCSGFCPSTVLAPLQAQGWLTASVHPVYSFAQPERALSLFAGTPCGVEGQAQALARLRPLWSGIGGQCFDIAAEHKTLYHTAAVFSSNFVPVLQAVAQGLWRHAGVPEALIPTLMAQLLGPVTQNVLAVGPAQALTGPAARGDTAVVQAERAALAPCGPEVALAYQTLSTLAARLAREGGLANPRLPDGA